MVDLHGDDIERELGKAIERKQGKKALQLIADGANVDWREEDDDPSFLMRAVVKNRIDLVRALVEAGADVNYEAADDDYVGGSALMWAAVRKRKEIYEYLLPLTQSDDRDLAIEEYRIRTRKLTKEDRALLKAAENGDATKIVELLDAGAEINCQRSKDRFTPLLLAVYQGNPEIVELLLERNARVDVCGRDEVSVLRLAVFQEPTIMKLLLEHDAVPDCNVSPGHITALFSKFPNVNIESYRLLIEAGADVNYREPWNGETPLYWAVEGGVLPRVKMLLEAGADILLRCHNGQTLLDLEEKVTRHKPERKEVFDYIRPIYQEAERKRQEQEKNRS